MSDQLEKLLAQEPIKEPAKRWRNWWKVIVDGVTSQETGEIGRKGSIAVSMWLFPSKEVAEQKAVEDLAWNLNHNGFQTVDYLGAFPEGERP